MWFLEKHRCRVGRTFIAEEVRRVECGNRMFATEDAGCESRLVDSHRTDREVVVVITLGL